MRTFPKTVAIIFASAFTAAAQLSVEVVIDQDQFLREESLPVKVRITNRTGQPLKLGQDNQWLSFVVEGMEGALVSKLADPPVAGEFTLQSAQVATRLVDLMPSFDLTEAGRYRVTATVRLPEWGQEIPSKPKPFEIVRGTKLWQQDFGIPKESGPPEARRYTLQQASYRKQLKLYVRLTDLPETKVFRVFPIGQLVSFSQPEAQVDRASYLHVLFQTGPRSFLFQVISPDGDVVVRQSYEYNPNRPTLRVGDDGRIVVSGGTRKMAISDIPPSEGRTNATNEPLPAPKAPHDAKRSAK